MYDRTGPIRRRLARALHRLALAGAVCGVGLTATCDFGLIEVSAQNAVDRSPQPGEVHVTNGYCLAPDVHDRLIEVLLNQGEPAAMQRYQEAKQMGACRSRKVKAEYLERTYRFDWPGRADFAGEQWRIRLTDSDRSAHVLLMVQQPEG